MNVKSQLNIMWKACMAACFAIALLVMAPATETRAQDATAISNILCNATNQLTGTIGRSISILIVISLAIALFLGKVSWGLAIAVAVGMGILFGARDVVNILSGGTACNL